MSSWSVTPRQTISRLLWKEFRQVRWFALLVVLCGCFAQAYGVVGASLVGASDSRLEIWSHPAVLIPTLIPMLFAIGCGATIFSNEHDSETFLFQRLLPVSGRQILGVKLGLAIGLTALLFFVLWVSSVLLYSNWEWLARSLLFVIPLSGLVVSEMLVWSLFFSVIEKRPLFAIGKAIACGVLSVFLCNALSTLLLSPDVQESSVIVGRILLILALTIVTRAKAIDWYESEKGSTTQRLLKNPWATTIDFSSLRSSTFGSLIWLQVRTTWLVMFAIGFGGLLAIERWAPLFSAPPLWACLAAGIGAVSLYGISKRRALVLQMGASPSQVWLSQWCLPIAMIVPLLAYYFFLGRGSTPSSLPIEWQPWLMPQLYMLTFDADGPPTLGIAGFSILSIIAATLIGLALGMFCSMLSGRLILSVFLALVSSVIMQELVLGASIALARNPNVSFTGLSFLITSMVFLCGATWWAFASWLKAETFRGMAQPLPRRIRGVLTGFVAFGIASAATSIGSVLLLAPDYSDRATEVLMEQPVAMNPQEIQRIEQLLTDTRDSLTEQATAIQAEFSGRKWRLSREEFYDEIAQAEWRLCAEKVKENFYWLQHVDGAQLLRSDFLQDETTGLRRELASYFSNSLRYFSETEDVEMGWVVWQQCVRFTELPDYFFSTQPLLESSRMTSEQNSPMDSSFRGQ